MYKAVVDAEDLVTEEEDMTPMILDGQLALRVSDDRTMRRKAKKKKENTDDAEEQVRCSTSLQLVLVQIRRLRRSHHIYVFSSSASMTREGRRSSPLGKAVCEWP